MADRHPIPMVVLAGSDRKPVVMPESGAQLHPLSGYKGMDLRVAGDPLIDRIVRRLEESGCFSPIFIAGPHRIYGEMRGSARVVDTDGTLGENIEAAIAVVSAEHPEQSIGFSSCDILPEIDELHRLMDDFYRNSPLDLWFPLILAPERSGQLGAAFWKPKYKIVPRPGEKAETLLPGHLVVVDPDALRLPLVYRTFNVAYASRNRPILYRLGLIVSHIFAGLLLQDLRRLFTFHLPTLTYTVIYNGIALAFNLRSGTITSEELGKRLQRIFVKFRHRRRHPERKGRLPLMHGLSLAKDIDTEEEAKELARGLQR